MVSQKVEVNTGFYHGLVSKVQRAVMPLYNSLKPDSIYCRLDQKGKTQVSSAEFRMKRYQDTDTLLEFMNDESLTDYLNRESNIKNAFVKLEDLVDIQRKALIGTHSEMVNKYLPNITIEEIYNGNSENSGSKKNLYSALKQSGASNNEARSFLSDRDKYLKFLKNVDIVSSNLTNLNERERSYSWKGKLAQTFGKYGSAISQKTGFLLENIREYRSSLGGAVSSRGFKRFLTNGLGASLVVAGGVASCSMPEMYDTLESSKYFISEMYNTLVEIVGVPVGVISLLSHLDEAITAIQAFSNLAYTLVNLAEFPIQILQNIEIPSEVLTLDLHSTIYPNNWVVQEGQNLSSISKDILIQSNPNAMVTSTEIYDLADRIAKLNGMMTQSEWNSIASRAYPDGNYLANVPGNPNFLKSGSVLNIEGILELISAESQTNDVIELLKAA